MALKRANRKLSNLSRGVSKSLGKKMNKSMPSSTLKYRGGWSQRKGERRRKRRERGRGKKVEKKKMAGKERLRRGSKANDRKVVQ